MLKPIENLEGFAGPSGVGALCLLGLFMVVDGQSPSAGMEAEYYAKSGVAVALALPLLAGTYVIGIVVISFAETLVEKIFGPTNDEESCDLFTVDKLQQKKDSLVTQKYIRLRQEKSLLAGSAVTLPLLAVGLVSEANVFPSLRIAIYLCSGLVLCLSAAVFYFSGLKGKAAHALAERWRDTEGSASEKS